MPPSSSKMGGDKNFSKQADVGMGVHKTVISRRGVTFLGTSSKDLPGKWKLHNFNYIHITLKLCKIYAYSENIHREQRTLNCGVSKYYHCEYVNLP